MTPQSQTIELPNASTSIESVLNSDWPIPLWLTVLIAVGLLALVGSLYWSERGMAGRKVRWLLSMLRFSLLAIVLWMMAGWSWLQFQSDLPELVIVVDRSASMSTQDEPVASGQRQTRFEAAVYLFSSLEPQQRVGLREAYQLKWFTVSESLEPRSVNLAVKDRPFSELAVDGVQSRLGDSLSRLLDRQAGTGTAAIVFISDGATTSGLGLADAAQKARAAAIPIHSVVVGKQNVQPDLRLVDLLVDRQVYLGDQVALELSVVSSDILASKAQITLRDLSSRRVLDSITVDLSSEKSQQQVRLNFVPDRSGEIPLELSVDGLAEEADLSNNRLETSVVVQDKSIKVLMVFGTASYEFRFLKSLLERSQQVGGANTASFELESVLQDADPEYVEQDATAVRLVPSLAADLKDFDVFVFGEFDPSLVSRSAQQAIFEIVTSQGAGCIFVWADGAQGSQLAGWPLAKLLPIDISVDRSVTRLLDRPSGPFRWQPTSLGINALPMQFSTTPDDSLRIWQQLPEFDFIAEVGPAKTGAQVLATAMDTASGRELPLLITQFAGAGRTALQASDETYRWTSFGGSDQYHQRYWGQMLRWLSRGRLSAQDRESKLVVEPKQSKLGQPLRFQLTLGDDINRSQLPESAEVSIVSADGRQRSLSLARSDSETLAFQSTVSDLVPGSYRALLMRPALASPPDAEFVVVAPPGEQANLRADPDAMQLLAQMSRGKSYTSADAAQLFENLPPGNSTRLGNLPPLPFWNSHWIALLFVLLLTTEWLLRRHVRML